MLTDAALKALKPKKKIYKVADRDGMYVRVMPSGAISFRLDYRLNGRRETVYLGRYGRDGISLARAREKCIDARRTVGEGRSPTIEKQRDKRRLKEAKSFGEFGEKWLTAAPMAGSTRAMRRSIFERELLPVWRNRLLTEITPDDLRAHCGGIVERGAPATARECDDGRPPSLSRPVRASSSVLVRSAARLFASVLRKRRRCVAGSRIIPITSSPRIAMSR